MGILYARYSNRHFSDYFHFFSFIYPVLRQATGACGPHKGSTVRKSVVPSAFTLREFNHGHVEFRGSYATDFNGASIPAQPLNRYKHFFLWLLENSDAKHEPYLQFPGAHPAAPAAPHCSHNSGGAESQIYHCSKHPYPPVLAGLF